jgi:hypothetical protein
VTFLEKILQRESDPTRREMLRAIFGDKAGDVDASLKASPSLHGSS